MTLPRVVPQSGYDIGGYHMPAGSVIDFNPWVVHRSKEEYDQDVYAFRPERWRKGDNGDMHHFFFALGSRARSDLQTSMTGTIAEEVAIQLAPTLSLYFDLELTGPEAILEGKCYWLVSQKGLNVRLRRRQLPAKEGTKV
ncbi:hypothetical protein CMEL01_15961 [Colletotrichum melonis]|uniref:Uncharacterized protein n=1 Tax=Colletotrichum melonis TaxID=1209925 RepID=A0AAI9XNR3_9PEZI|nr:hypothetical protein CMEL01_15961 [Colletotrichum melonis]